MSSARWIAATGAMALAAALVAVPAAGAAAKVRQVPAEGSVAIGSVRCTASEACAVNAAPRREKARVAGKAVRAKVVVPPVLGAGGKGVVKLRLGAGALQRLAGHTATFTARVVVRGDGKRVVRGFKARLSRPAAPAVKSAGSDGGAGVGIGNGGVTGEGAHSEAITGEAPALARPLTAVAVENVSVKWYPRASWVRYVATGEGTIAAAGALTVGSEISPCPAQAGGREGAEAAPSGQSFPYEVDFGPAASWFDPASGEAAIDGAGSVSFRYRGHTINLTGSEPEIQLNGAASQAVFRFSGSEGTPYPNQRVALLGLATTGQPTEVTTSEGRTTYTYSLMRGALTPDGEKVFAGFYPAPTNNGFGCVSASFTVPAASRETTRYRRGVADARQFELREPGVGDLGWVVARHGTVYHESYGWDASFEALVAGVIGRFAEDHDPARERGWIAVVDGRQAGSIFCVAEDGDSGTARLRMLLVEPWARGLGIGGALVNECVEFARAAGYRRMILWTDDFLVDARRLYAAAGFRLVASKTEVAFGTESVAEDWELIF